MLIELNRFMTTEEVGREYRVPAAVANDILPKLPVVVTQEDGTRIHLEKDVDEFLAEFSRKRRGVVLTSQHNEMPKELLQTATSSDVRLTETEANILEALGNDKLTGERLSRKAGYPCNSNFKNTLASLVKR